jgi:aerobic-type carbon monoxide dehydrogenase small subunit (CoxS/CutS family)
MPRIQLTINGEAVTHWVADNQSLLDFLREDLGLTGSKHGCDVGDCGACTVMLNDRPRLACISLAAICDGTDVQTIEGLGRHDKLHPVQATIHRHVGAQCGYCTPGIAMRLAALLKANPAPDDAAIRSALGANICRCTGYTKILAAAAEIVDEWTSRDTPPDGSLA